MNKEEKRETFGYEAPRVEVIEVVVEKGFAGSATLNGYEYENL